MMTTTQSSQSHHPIVGPVIVWTIVQLIPLGFACARVPLWARPTRAIEDYALVWMLAAQVAGSALLFPWLMSTLRSATFVVLITLPFLQLAGMIASVSFTTIASAGILLWVWLITLALWRVVLRTTATQLVGVSLSSSMALGTVMLLYVRIEFVGDPPMSRPVIVLVVLGMSFVSAVTAFLMSARHRATGYPPLSHDRSSTNSGKTASID